MTTHGENESRAGRAPGEHPLVMSGCRRTLIVEDERRLREMLLVSAKEMGLEPTGAPSAESALRILAETTFAVAVLDLNLPGMGGIELAEVVRRKWPLTQVIILTGFGDLDAARRAIRLDVADFLTKPCRMEELEQALSRAQERWRAKCAAESDPTAIADESPLQKESARGAAAQQPVISLEEMERELILAALKRRHGNREAVATDLGISLRKLYYRLQQYQRAGFLSAS